MCSAHVVTRGRAGENEAREASRVQSGMGGLGKMEGRGQSRESHGMDRTGVPSTAPPRTAFLSRDRTAPSCWAHLTLTGSFQLESNLPPEASPDSSFHALGNTDKFWSPHTWHPSSQGLVSRGPTAPSMFLLLATGSQAPPELGIK